MNTVVDLFGFEKYHSSQISRWRWLSKMFWRDDGKVSKWVSAQVSNWTDGVQLPRPQTVYATSKYVNQDDTNNKIHNPGWSFLSNELYNTEMVMSQPQG